MSSARTAPQTLDTCYLEVRCKLIEIAAALDRVYRAEDADAVDDDPRLKQFRDSLEVLAGPGFDRAERLQMIFSDEYRPDWNH